jgi:hypothetical protein
VSILEEYKTSGLLFNTNFLEQTGTPGVMGYRGELVLVKGEVGEDKGRQKPPSEIIRGVTVLAGDKIMMLAGSIDRLQQLQTLTDKYQHDFADDMLSVLFVVDISKPIQVELGGVNFVLIPLVQGVPWNELIDELRLEKSDFKGQSAANKVVTLFEELKSYRPAYPLTDYNEALGSTTGQVREGWGAV